MKVHADYVAIPFETISKQGDPLAICNRPADGCHGLAHLF